MRSKWNLLVDRRAFLRASALTALGTAIPAGWLAGCGDDGGGGGGGAATQPLQVDPSRPWWLQNNFAPVFDELDVFDLRVRGRIPAALDGLYVRNGSNPQNSDSPHWFFGDGMLHGVRIQGGRALWYRNRYVQTPLYQMGLGFADPSLPPSRGNNQSNVSCIYHAGKLLTSGEVGHPYRIDPADLSTIGVYDFDDKLGSSFTAHPKIDPETGYLHFFGYWFLPPYLTYQAADASGRIVHTQPIDVAGPTMVHSFAVTDRDVIFWELPVVFYLEDAIAGAANPFRWTPSYGARIGIMPLGGRADEIRWVEIEPCYVFHEVNAFRQGSEVVIDVCRHPYMFAGEDLNDSQPKVQRWRIDTAGSALAFREEVILDRGVELPSHDRRFTGRRHRHGWLVDTRDHPDTLDFAGTARIDFDTGRIDIWDPGSTRHSNEAFFVAGGTSEGEGWLLTFVSDHADGSSVLAILNAQRIADGPVAEIEMPRRVPDGFHAVWVPA